MASGKTRVKYTSGRRNESGSAAIEFGLSIPFLLFLLVGVIEVGYAMYQAMQVQNAAEVGMLYAAKYPGDADGNFNSTGIMTAVVNATGVTGIAATPAPTQFYGCAEVGGVTPVMDPALPCPDGTTPAQYAQINAALDHVTVLPYPGFGLPPTLRARSIIRLN